MDYLLFLDAKGDKICLFVNLLVLLVNFMILLVLFDISLGLYVYRDDIKVIFLMSLGSF